MLMKNFNMIGYKDEQGNYITNFEILSVREITFYPKDNTSPIDSLHITLNIEGTKKIIVKLYQDDYWEQMKKLGCICTIRNKLKFREFFYKKIAEFFQNNTDIESKLTVFENSGWNYILENNKKIYYYVFSDCSIGKEGIKKNIISAKDNQCLHYEKENLEFDIPQILPLINDNLSFFYPSIITTILSLSINILKKCDYLQLPIIWITGHTSAGKSTLLKDTFFLTETKNKTPNFYLSIQTKKSSFYKNIKELFDCIIVYDDIRKTKAYDSNQHMATVLEEIIRQNSESFDEKNNIFVVTGESDMLSNQSLSFKNRCLEFVIKDNFINNYQELLDTIKEKKLMKSLWVNMIQFIIKEKKELEKFCLENEKQWKKRYMKNFNPRVVKIGFAEHFPSLIFQRYLESLETANGNSGFSKNWKQFSLDCCFKRMQKTQLLYYGLADTFISMLKKLLLSKKCYLFSANYKGKNCNPAFSSFIIPEGDLDKIPIIGTYFPNGIKLSDYHYHKNRKGKAFDEQPFLLLNINEIITLFNIDLNRNFNYDSDRKVFFEQRSLQRELQKKGIIYVHRRSSEELKNSKESENYNYAITFRESYINYNILEKQEIPCWIINVNRLGISLELFTDIFKNIYDIFKKYPYNDDIKIVESWDNINLEGKWTEKIRLFLSDPINFIES